MYRDTDLPAIWKHSQCILEYDLASQVSMIYIWVIIVSQRYII